MGEGQGKGENILQFQHLYLNPRELLIAFYAFFSQSPSPCLQCHQTIPILPSRAVCMVSMEMARRGGN
ncbi:MAG: hypothetical protein A3K23_03790 [Desulfobacca sp. RBG_16_58_9]|nr:MAG: hypothetical protein A3K23_03790 [Desulfobacca sp. RBG_16_58_9]